MTYRYYRAPSRYRFARLRYGRRLTGGQKAAIAVAAVALAGAGHGAAGAISRQEPAGATPGAAKAVAYATAQLGCPYTWGGTGPCDDGFDCSGLVMEAWASAGVSIPRTSEEQWDTLPHVSGSQIEPGDLVFGPGGDGTWSAPGHVMMIISLHPAMVIEAYATGSPVMITSLSDGSAAMSGTVGYARP